MLSLHLNLIFLWMAFISDKSSVSYMLPVRFEPNCMGLLSQWRHHQSTQRNHHCFTAGSPNREFVEAPIHDFTLEQAASDFITEKMGFKKRRLCCPVFNLCRWQQSNLLARSSSTAFRRKSHLLPTLHGYYEWVKLLIFIHCRNIVSLFFFVVSVWIIAAFARCCTVPCRQSCQGK